MALGSEDERRKMAHTHTFAFKGNIISPPANIAVQGVGVKGGILTNDGTGVWKSADGLVSFTPANGISPVYAALQQQGNIVTLLMRVNDVALTANIGTVLGSIAGVPESCAGDGNAVSASIRAWLGSDNSYVSANSYINNNNVNVCVGITASVRIVIAVTYSTAASGSVNPADSKSILVDNEDTGLGTVYSMLQGTTPPTVVTDANDAVAASWAKFFFMGNVDPATAHLPPNINGTEHYLLQWLPIADGYNVNSPSISYGNQICYLTRRQKPYGNAWIRHKEGNTWGSWRMLDMPEMPTSGTYTLKVINGVPQWVSG